MDPDALDVVIRLVAAAALSGVVGLERELAGQDAGFRTHLLLGLGSGLFGAVSVDAFDAFLDPARSTNVTIDITRVASYVAAGVGFIGGGVIIKHAGRIEGLTTASSVWSVSAIGLAAGVGFWPGAVSATGLSLIALVVLKPIGRGVSRLGRQDDPALSVSLSRRDTLPDVLAAVSMVTPSTWLHGIRFGDGETDGATELVLTLRSDLPDGTLDEVVRVLGRQETVTHIRVHD